MNLNPSYFRQTTLIPESGDVKHQMRLDPFEKIKDEGNDKIIEKHNFIAKMEKRVSRMKEVCSRFHESYNGR